MRILLLGAPGTGKSTVGKRLAVDMGWFWLSSGELLRESQEQWVIDKLKTAELFDDDMIICIKLGIFHIIYACCCTYVLTVINNNCF